MWPLSPFVDPRAGTCWVRCQMGYDTSLLKSPPHLCPSSCIPCCNKTGLKAQLFPHSSADGESEVILPGLNQGVTGMAPLKTPREGLLLSLSKARAVGIRG